MASAIKKIILSHTSTTCAACIIDDLVQGLRIKLNAYTRKTGTTHAKLSYKASIEYIETVHKNLLHWGKIRRFKGTVAEIGPGDNFGVALMMLNDGADHVYAIDRFYSWRDAEQQKRIYEGLAKKYSFEHIFKGKHTESSIEGLTYSFGTPAEIYFKDSAKMYDAIVSCAVLEHLYDPIVALNHMYSALKPGGIMVHSIDLRDHGLFANKHPLTFLTIPDAIYKLMSKNTGRPNRVLFSEYMRWIDGINAEGSLRIMYLHGGDHYYGAVNWCEIHKDEQNSACNLVETIKSKLPTKYSSLSVENLAVAACVLYAKKP